MPDIDIDIEARARAGLLGVPRLLGVVMAVVTPLTVAVAVIPAGYAQVGSTALAATFVVVTVVMAAFLPGYLAMGRTIGHPGGFYAFAAAGWSPAAGAAAGAVALLSYASLLAGLYGVIGSAAAPLLEPAGIHAHWAVLAVVMLAVVTALSAWRITVPTTVVLVLLILDLAWVGLTYAVLLAAPAPGVDVAAVVAALVPDDPWALVPPAPLAFLAWVGIETVMTYRSSVRGQDTIGRATRLAVPALGAVYLAAAVSPLVAVGPGGIVQAARDHGDGLVFVLVAERLPDGLAQAWVFVGHVLFAGGVVAAMLAFTLPVTATISNLSADRLLPRALGLRSQSTGAPVRACAALAAGTAAVITAAAALDWRPVEHLFLGGGAVGALGVLLLLTTTSVLVVTHLRRSSAPGTRIALAITAAVALLGLSTVSLAGFDQLLAPSTMFLWWAAPAAFVAAAAAGAARAWWLRRRDPQVYDAIGTLDKAGR
ncbi:amino acid permease [Saccharothrix sp.]|uniref:amino acid permease n=1 Tax=Saccharothrix sp. TaxID=1873460 RepID=UPI0028121538|nr:amino acid permease [Saccharothrix sp.]